MRLIRSTVALVLTGVLVGCQQPYFMTETDYVYHNEVSGHYTGKSYQAEQLLSEYTPRTVRNPTRDVLWELSLEESKTIALENNKQIAFLAYQPGEAGTQIELALSAFDATISGGGVWGYTNQQVVSAVQVFGTGDSATTSKTFGPSAGSGINATAGGATQDSLGSIPGSDIFSFSKRNAAGGLSSFSYSIDYQNVDPVSVFTAINPSWRSIATVSLEQPLLQGAGVEFNRSQILLARSTYEQTIRNFDTSVRTLLRDVELAYWNLYFTYQDLFSREVGMKQALVTWQKEKNKYDVGVGSKPDVAQAREQYEFFRAARLEALGRTLTAERDLRELMGLPPDDYRQIIPKDDPTIAEYSPTWSLAVQETLDLRPELIAQRYAVRSAEIESFRQKNGLLPDVTFSGSYGATGLDDQLDQSIDRLTDMNFTDWVLGIRYRQQIGERAAHAAVRNSTLALTRERLTLKNLEHTLLHDLHEAYQGLITAFELIQVQKDRRQAAAEQLRAREEFYKQGRTTIDVLLQAQASFADALRDEGQAIVQYNQALISWEFEKGTILANDNVALMEEAVSRTSEKTLRERQWQADHSVVIPLHQGHKVQGELLPSPDQTGPLYPQRFQHMGNESTSLKSLDPAKKGNNYIPTEEPNKNKPKTDEGDVKPPTPKTEPMGTSSNTMTPTNVVNAPAPWKLPRGTMKIDRLSNPGNQGTRALMPTMVFPESTSPPPVTN